jgi:hypothetical protein
MLLLLPRRPPLWRQRRWPSRLPRRSASDLPPTLLGRAVEVD